ncbi:MAG: indolepyruvate oxidoreductase subunit beta [Clostridia bacterium]|nr:indolepyruvate oxidoreductase subunit beta [Clostridia bacterium]
MNKDIMICGVGGQGTVLASKIIAAAAMDEGNAVHSAETIGMAQRGGSVTSHVRVGEAYSPLIPYGSADLIISFEPAEAVRNLIYLKKDGIVITNSVPTKPVTASISASEYNGVEMVNYLNTKCKVITVNSDDVCSEFGSNKFFNIAILGVAVGSGRLGISKETILKEIEARVPAKFIEVNKAAFEAGLKIGESYEA